ncbi:MAG TPA: hypothetical protein VNM45_15570 [Bacillus sp. (in: firmicutes)]|nr:hypothetical protein [Bacillus sp. (in: firmicutes)]
MTSLLLKWKHYKEEKRKKEAIIEDKLDWKYGEESLESAVKRLKFGIGYSLALLLFSLLLVIANYEELNIWQLLVIMLVVFYFLINVVTGLFFLKNARQALREQS